MKRKELLRQLEEVGCNLIRRGRKHDWYQNPKTKIVQPVPRHNEVSDNPAKHIIENTEHGVAIASFDSWVAWPRLA